ncbi:MAG: hypothetical protein KDD33_06435, partial [Bdellovibrionales bacterium]|nr:hypothetical protein [Bdellovibrionales bacterium]
FYKELGPALANYVEQKDLQLLQNDHREKSADYVSLRAESAEQKKVLSGVITTSRFFSRFQTTKINKNRRRAAQIFRIFLCDAMKPIVLSSEKEDRELLEKSLQLKMAHGGTIDLPNEKRHASDQQCQSCHYKLDPMANLFAGSSVYLNPFSPKGALVYNKDMNPIEVTGLYEMSQNLVQQEQYAKCQTQHFWNWIIGEDVPLEPEIHQEITEQFNSLDRKPKDFITYLAKRKEFSSPPLLKEDDIRYSHVKPIFKRCDSCHADEPLAPELSSGYPFPSFMSSNVDILKSLVKATDINNRGQKSSMPPKKANWKLTPHERDLIFAWLKGGAKDDKGETTVDSPDSIGLEDSRSYEKGFKDKLEPTFYNTYRRLVSGHELPDSLLTIFGSTPDYNCDPQFFDGDGNNMGYSVVATGLPLFKYVNPNYLRWWMKCLTSYQYSLSTFGKNFEQNQAEPKISFTREDGLRKSWKDLNESERTQIFNGVAEIILGPGILSDSRQQLAKKRAFEKINKNPDEFLDDVIAKMAMVLLITEEYLTY